MHFIPTFYVSLLLNIICSKNKWYSRGLIHILSCAMHMQSPCLFINLLIKSSNKEKDLCGGKGKRNPLSATRMTSLSTSYLSQIQNPIELDSSALTD